MGTVRQMIGEILEEEATSFVGRVRDRIDEAFGASTEERTEALPPLPARRLPYVKDAILAILADGKTLPFGAIRATDALRRVSDVTVRNALTELRNENRVQMTGDRRTALYSLVPTP
jgi:hypothetical protein